MIEGIHAWKRISSECDFIYCIQQAHLPHSTIAMSMQGSLAAAIDFVDASQQGGVTGEDLARNINNQVVNFLNTLRHMDYEQQDATACIRMLNNMNFGPFSREQRFRMVQAINVRVNDALQAPTTSNAEKKQTNSFLFNYYPKYIWDVLENVELDETIRCDNMIEYNQKIIGLKFPCPETRKVMTAIVLGACGTTSPSAEKAFEVFTKLSKRNTAYRKFTSQFPERMRVYPLSVAEFRELHSDAYPAEQPPIDSKVPSQTIDQIVLITSARKNNSMLKEASIKHNPSHHSSNIQSTLLVEQPSGHNNPLQSLGQMMMQNMMQHFQNMASSQQHNRPEIDITVQRRQGRGNNGNNLALDWQEPGDANTQSNAPPLRRAETMDSPNSSIPSTDKTVTLEDTATVEDDIDKMINGEMQAPAPDKKSKGVKRPAAGTTATYEKNSPPPFGTSTPFLYNGAKVYPGAKKFRVYPLPGVSVYDKGFPFTADTKEAVWKVMLKFCENPKVPESSVNNPGAKSPKGKAKAKGKKSKAKTKGKGKGK